MESTQPHEPFSLSSKIPVHAVQLLIDPEQVVHGSRHDVHAPPISDIPSTHVSQDGKSFHSRQFAVHL